MIGAFAIVPAGGLGGAAVAGVAVGLVNEIGPLCGG